MDVSARSAVSASPEEAFAALADLGTYPAWMGLVRRAEPSAALDGDDGPAWSVEVGARLGPIWKTKTVRMVRTAHEPSTSVRFERMEHDGRSHSPWVLTAEVAPAVEAQGADVAVHLHYGGGGWMPLVELALRAEMSGAGERLDAHLAG